MLLTINQLAERECVSQFQIRHWIREHRLPTVRVGARIMVRLERYQEWLQSKEDVAKPSERFVPPEPYEPQSAIAKKMRKIY